MNKTLAKSWHPFLVKSRKGFYGITEIQFSPEHGYYWDTKQAQIIAFAKQMIDATWSKPLMILLKGI